jgi:hypothetical protein
VLFSAATTSTPLSKEKKTVGSALRFDAVVAVVVAASVAVAVAALGAP